jgi:hypothetical protein
MTLKQENEFIEWSIAEAQASIKKVDKLVRNFGPKEAVKGLFEYFLTIKPEAVAGIAASLAVVAAQQQSEGGFVE